MLKNVLAPLGITADASENEEMNGVMKIVQDLDDSNIFLKGVLKTIKNETKKQKWEFWSMLLGTLGASLSGNLLSGKGIVRAGSGNKKGKGIVMEIKKNGIFKAASPFNKLWNTKVLSKWTKI